jgi:hypothetical protein
MDKYNIEKLIGESNNELNQRIIFIKKLEKFNLTIKEIINYSKIWYCIKFKKCKYDNDIHNKIMNYDKS